MFSQAIKFFEISVAKFKLFFWQMKNKSSLAPLILPSDTNNEQKQLRELPCVYSSPVFCELCYKPPIPAKPYSC